MPPLQIDRNTLPRHDFASTAAYVAPTTEVERVVQRAWQVVLSHIIEPISIHDNFFKVGNADMSFGSANRLICCMKVHTPCHCMQSLLPACMDLSLRLVLCAARR